MAKESFFSRFKNSFNVFKKADEFEEQLFMNPVETVSWLKPDRTRLTRGNERSIINAIYTRLSMDVAAIKIEHVNLDENGRYLSARDSGLNNALTLEANIDQTGRAFIQDLALSLFDKGCVAVVPVDTDSDPNLTDSYDIKTLRVGEIKEWSPLQVRVELYNDRTGKREDIWVRKDSVAIIENPMYPIMNEPNSTAQRLIRKLNLLDAIDEQSGSGKLDLIIQLPYTIKTQARQQQAEQRRKLIEDQLAGSKYGIAYIDGTEHITQINRAVENNLLNQVEYLTNMLYSQLGLTESVMNGTASEAEMLNYYNRTIEPVLSAIANEFKRKFLTKTARTQGQSIEFFRDPFRLIPAEKLAELADKFTRNEIMTSNEFRAIIGYRPSTDPSADELRNKNLNQSPEAMVEEKELGELDEEIQNGINQEEG